MSLSATLLPLRLTKSQQDIAEMLGAWMDNLPISLRLRSVHCKKDFQRISSLRQSIRERIGSRIDYEGALQSIDDMHEYYNFLLECEEIGLKSPSGSTPQLSEGIYLVLEWESALSGQLQTVYHSLEWERSGIIWNIVALETYQATQQSLDNKGGWNQAAQHLQKGASWLQHLPTTDQQQLQYPDFSSTFIHLWQSLLVAQSQRCIYESLACQPRPRHLLLAKLAAAAVLLFADVEAIIRKDDESTAPALTQFSTVVDAWRDISHAWGILMSCKAEFHQSQLCRERKEWGQELARLDLAYQYAAMCKESLEKTKHKGLQQLYDDVEMILKDLQCRVNKAEQEGHEHGQPIPKRQELTEIRAEKLVNIDQPLLKLLKPKMTEPIFRALSQEPDIRPYIQMVDSQVQRRVCEITKLAEDQTQLGRAALAKVNLPHSLTAYHQEQSGDGLPQDLWERIDTVQRGHHIPQLKQDLWELKDMADFARSTSGKIQSQLDFDLESDRLFRDEYRGFEGHDAEEVQKDFRLSLANFDRLLETAKIGDSVLLKGLDQLDTNPKFKLLQFQRSQLDILFTGSTSVGQAKNVIDTSQLDRLLVHLSNLFDERKSLLQKIDDSWRSFDATAALESWVDARAGSDELYRDAVEKVQKPFESMFVALKCNIDKQDEFVQAILVENEHFRRERERSNTTQSGISCISMIEEAMEEIEELSSHLREGKDFYNVMIPKLDRLKHQVGDLSARLKIERLEYADKTHLARQEAKDAAMALNLSSESQDERGVVCKLGSTDGVDDGKVATLVAMDFEPTRSGGSTEKTL